jgi:predicted SAM-dependent methyltransferase
MIKINMGCGKRNFGKDWKHIDKASYDHIDHQDIFNFPYENVDLIYASHLIEYFDQHEVKRLLDYWYTKLKVGGVLRLAVPCFETISKLYLSGVNLDSFIGPLYGRIKIDDKIIYHRMCYDYKTLSNILLSSKYVNISRWDHTKVDHGKFDDCSQAYIPHMDKVNGKLISLNVQCDKK